MIPPDTSKGTLHALRANTNGPLSQSDIFATVVDIHGVETIRPYDGLSLRKVVPSERVRFCSEFMPTFSNNPNAACVDDQARILKLDFTRMQVFDADDSLLSRIKDLNKNVLRVLEQRL